jgi:UDP-N-acetylmuramyl pentapeptide phosphotransferase/UDP-N-acetylglucosamine-1-phosphate transferase
MIAYIVIAKRFKVIDLPTRRSSHTYPTVRGGGILFPIGAAIWFIIFGWEQPYAVFGLLLISLISFVDDLKSLPGSLRIVFHLIAIGLLFYDVGLFSMHWYLLIASLILTIGWINAFNFMDGINAMTAFYSLVLLGTFSLLNNAPRLLSSFFVNTFPEHWEPFLPGGLVGVLFLSVLIFTFFNAKTKALVFAGDVGSISMAFLQSWMMINLMVQTRQAFWILLFSVYGIDSVITILIRLHRRENIFKSHRLHLYQLLANERKLPHLFVAAAYAIIQMAMNLLTIYLTFTSRMNFTVFLSLVIVFVLVYTVIRIQIMKPKST